LSKEELVQLDRAKALLAKHWQREPDGVDRADVIRASVAMLAAELEEAQLGQP
jgi:hypothetical protein